MDEIVKQALAKWPNVPHCHGWLALDARGHWRMRDEHVQRHDLPGERITSPALIGFIQRNYTHDERGNWYFQNGPQRVYVDLEVAPHVVRTDPAAGFVLHTGQAVAHLEAAWLTDHGRLLLQADGKLCLLDDRDMAECLPRMRRDRNELDEESLLHWIAQEGQGHALTFLDGGDYLPVGYVKEEALETQFGFVKRPRAPHGD